MGELQKISIKNRKASFSFELLEEFDCGIKLLGSEIKSIRQGQISISEAYCYVNDNEVFVKNMHIPALKEAVIPHDPMRVRKLLLTKKEIRRIVIELQNQGQTLIPTYLYNKKGLVKLKVRLAKGKKLWNKKNSLKEADIKRETDRELNSL